MIWITAPLLGIVLGYLGHGRLRHFAALPLPFALLTVVWLALGLELGAQLFPKALEFAAVMTGTMLVFAFLIGFWALLGRRSFGRGVRTAVVILAVGWLMNTAVIAANGGMPVSKGALEQVGLPQVVGTGDPFNKHVPMTHETALQPLADVIPLQFPGRGVVVSLGDVVLGLGFFILFAAVMRPRFSLRRSQRAATCSTP